MPEETPKKRSRGRHFLYSLVACVGIVASGMLLATVASSYRVSTATGEQDPPPRLPNVNVMLIEPVTVYDNLRLTGGVEPWHDLTLSAEVGGRIVSQPVREGQRVKAGDTLVRIDTDLLNARLEEIEARLELARADAGRLTRLRERGAGTPQDADRAATEVRVLEATLRTARINLEKSIVRSPVDGVIDTLHREESEYVDSGMPLVRIVQVERLKVLVGLPERDAPFFRKGDAVEIQLDALPGRPFTGAIHAIATTASPGTRTFRADVEVDNEDGAILPGMIARVGLVRQEFPESILIPMAAIISLDDRRIVFVEDNELAQPREVVVGLVQGAEVQVLSGLEAGDRLIVTGQRDVRPGHGVAVREVIRGSEPFLPAPPREIGL